MCTGVFQRGTLQNELEVLSACGGHIELQRVLRLFRGICKGLNALHTHTPQPLAHRYDAVMIIIIIIIVIIRTKIIIIKIIY